METNIIIADFDDRKFKPYKGNRSVDIEFNTYTECENWIKENKFYKGFKPELGWDLQSGNYHKSWEWLMPVIEKIGRIKTPDNKYDNGEPVFVECIYPRTFGMKNQATGKYMFRFNGFGVWESEHLLEAAYLAVVNVLKTEKFPAHE